MITGIDVERGWIKRGPWSCSVWRAEAYGGPALSRRYSGRFSAAVLACVMRAAGLEYLALYRTSGGWGCRAWHSIGPPRSFEPVCEYCDGHSLRSAVAAIWRALRAENL